MSKNKITITSIAIIAVLIASTGYLAIQNSSLDQNYTELQMINTDLTNTNAQLASQIQNLTGQIEALNQSYTQLESYFGPNPNPIIETRLGIKLIDRPTIGDNYLWVTGEVENTEEVTAYNVVLNFTLYTYQDTQFKTINIGTMEPHQVVEIRTSVQSATFKTINWSLEATATFLP